MIMNVSDEDLGSTVRDWQEYLSTRSTTSRDRLVTYYFKSLSLPMARRFARKAVYSGCIDEEDMAQESVFALLRAVEKYDPNHPRDASFETFATPRVDGSMKSYLRSLDKVPRLNRLRSKTYEKAVRGLMAERDGESPSDEAIRVRMSVSEKEYADAKNAGDFELIKMSRPVVDLQLPYIQLIITDLRMFLSEGLSDREIKFLNLHFFSGKRIRELPELFGVKTSGAVSYIKNAVIKKIRGRF